MVALNHARVSSAIQQHSRCHFKRLGELLDHRDRRIPRTAFDIADIGAVDAGTVGIILLAPPLIEPELPNILTEALANIHV